MDYGKSNLESVGRKAFVVLCRILRQNVILLGLSLSHFLSFDVGKVGPFKFNFSLNNK